MEALLTRTVVAARGLPPEKHSLKKATQFLEHKGQYIDLQYRDLLDQLLLANPELDNNTDYHALYQRVWKWCQNNNIGYRTPNKVSKKNEALVNQRCCGTLLKVEEFVKQEKLQLEDLVNVDETGLRPLLIL